jgi:hypothetical protein
MMEKELICACGHAQEAPVHGDYSQLICGACARIGVWDVLDDFDEEE